MNKIVSARYKGTNYMVIDGSPRHQYLNQAHALWCVCDPTERDVYRLALSAEGCAFDAREAQIAGEDGDIHV